MWRKPYRTLTERITAGLFSDMQRRTTTETILRASSTYTLILQRNRYGRIV
ncbi:MAG: hypothetical protein JXB62_06855 [Pirellulales bacterium]|nr:hypothetical protein [Pirellulales bacterium]